MDAVAGKLGEDCIGCPKCIAACPVDCIVMQPAPPSNTEQNRAQKSAQAKLRYDACCLCKEKEEAEKAERAKKKKLALLKMQAAKK